MQRARIPTGALAFALATGAVATVVAQQGQPQARRPLKVGVVDIGILFRDYKRKDVLEQAVNAERERVKSEIEAARKEIQQERVGLDNGPFREGSEPYLQALDQIKLKQYQLELKVERLQGALKKRVEELTLQVLTEIERTIEAYGKRHGYDLILKSDKDTTGGDARGELAQQFQERIFRAQISHVLFYDGGMEISAAVLQTLNSDENLREMERRAAERGKPAAGAPAAADDKTRKP